jgi:Divergent InlB B-repeat domain/Immunoglobulin I-set domain
MFHAMNPRLCFASNARVTIAFIFAAVLSPSLLQASGVVNTPDEAALRAALAGGGAVTFGVDGTITLTRPLTITNATAIDAAGHSIILSGNNAVRVFEVNNGVQMTVRNLTVANGLTNYGAGLYNDGGVVTLSNVIFSANQAVGANGIAAASNQPPTIGGSAAGGAIYNNGSLTLLRCQFAGNGASGGTGGAGDHVYYGGDVGGLGQGGAIYTTGTFNTFDCQFSNNIVLGGQPGTNALFNGNSGAGGAGGAIYAISAQLINCAFTDNGVRGGDGGPAGGFIYSSGPGGQASGGAVYVTAWLAMSNCTFSSNQASGGNSPGADGYPGSASGGAVYNAGGTLSFSNCSLVKNSANCGRAAHRSTTVLSFAGGGAICSLTGVVSVANSVIASNSVYGNAAGGGIYHGAGTLTIFGGSVLGNQAQSGHHYYSGLPGLGGGLFNSGTASISDCTFGCNSAGGGSGFGMEYNWAGDGGAAEGGGICNSGALDISRCTLTANAATGGPPGANASVPIPPAGGTGYGGGIYNTGSLLRVYNCTLATNSAVGGPGAYGYNAHSFCPAGDSYGGGIYNTSASVSLIYCTLAGNAALGGAAGVNGTNSGSAGRSYGGNIAQSGGLQLVNTIVAFGLSNNAYGSLTDLGHNISSDASCAFTSVGSLNNADPLLGPLADNGGPTQTMALLPGSPAIDAAVPQPGLNTDQRGVARPFGSAPDIGAYEWNGTNANPGLLNPNRLTPPIGSGPPDNFVSASSLFAYRIDFEFTNYFAATNPAPVQVVVISNALASTLDWTAFELQEVGFGSNLFSLPPGTQHYSRSVPITNQGVAFEVQIDAGLDAASGVLSVTFTSIDPKTGLPPQGTNGIVGFLEPEDGTGRGMGHVTYVIRPKAGLPTGTAIRNVATVAYDPARGGAGYRTDLSVPSDPNSPSDGGKQALVTLDASPPTSSVTSLSATQSNLYFVVCWSGTDSGSGITGYDIYVSTNNGPWAPWLLNTPLNCSAFSGQSSTTYAFFSVAHDAAGNSEPARDIADAQTTTPFIGIGPSILSQPLSRTNIAGTSVTFGVAVDGTPPLSYRWQWNGKALNDGGNIAGAAAANLTLTGVAQSNAGSYLVVVSNPGGSVTSHVATLTVLDPPLITSHPASRTNNAGTSASLSVAAIGTTPLRYQWFKISSASLPPSAYETNALSEGGNISGATNSTLTLSNVFGADTASYFVVVANSAGSAASSNAVLVVLDPVITTEPQGLVRNAGAQAQFTVTAAGTAPLHFQWQLNGADLAEGGRVGGSQSNVLTLGGLQRGDAGNYRVLVTNLFGSVTSSVAVLSVQDGSLQVLLSPAGAVSAGAQWQVDGGPPQASGAIISGLAPGSHTLVFSTVTGWTAPPSQQVTVLVNQTTSAQGQYSAIPCNYSVAPLGTNLPASDASGVFDVLAATWCDWNSAPTASWIHATNSGAGNGTVNYFVEANSTTNSRTGSIMVQDKAFAIEQAGAAACQLTLAWSPPAGGSVAGSGVFAAGTTRTVTATPAPGYTFKNWSENGLALSTSAAYDFVIASNRLLVANFAPIPASNYSIAVAIGTNGGGWVGGQGTFKAGSKRTVTATPKRGYIFAYWSENGLLVSSNINYSFILNGNRTLAATFIPNPFSAVKGNYSGLFADSNGVSPQSAGSFRTTVSASGSFSASFQLQGKAYSMSGQFDYSGQCTRTIKRPGLNPPTVQFQLDLTSGSDRIAGAVSSEAWTAELSGDRAVFDGLGKVCPQVGNYTLMLFGAVGSANLPAGDGYGTVNVARNGTARLSGSLADGTRITQAAMISKGGEWPLFVSAYGGEGCVMAWVGLTGTDTNDLQGGLAWIKPKLPKTKYYPDGFRIATTCSGWRYSPPQRGANVLSLAEGDLALFGGNMVLGFTNRFTLGRNNRVVSTNKSLSLSFTPATGLFVGHVVNPAFSTKPIAFGGILLQRMNAGRGFFLGTNQSGQVFLGP